MSYVQILDHLDHQEQQEDLYKFRAITGHQGPLSPHDENYKGSKYNVMVEWETQEITDEPLSLIAADDPVTCAEYAKKHDLLHLDDWKRLKHIAKNQKQLTRAINQSKIRQVRRSAVYQFGFLIPKDYKQALQLDPKSRKVSNAPNGYQKIRVDTRPDWLLEDISLQIPLKAYTLELSPSDSLDWIYSSPN